MVKELLSGTQDVLDFAPWASWFLMNWDLYLEGASIFLEKRLGLTPMPSGGVQILSFVIGLFMMGFVAAWIDGTFYGWRPIRSREKGAKWLYLFEYFATERFAIGVATAFLTLSVFLTIGQYLLFGKIALVQLWWVRWYALTLGVMCAIGVVDMI